MEFWRQQGIVSQESLNRMPIHIIGVGGVGSPTAIVLAKMGCENITVYDPDILEPHNLPNQFYRIEDITKPKVEALKEIVKSFTGTEIKTVQKKFETQKGVQGLVISGVDSMKSRKKIWKKLINQPRVTLYIEARMGAELAIVYSLNPCDPDLAKWYETTLYDDKDAVQAPCTERAIMYNVFMIAALIGSQTKKFLNGERISNAKEVIFDLSTLTFLKS